MSDDTYNRVVSLLTEAKVQFNLKEHEPTHSSEQSAAARGTPLTAGAKAIILKLTMRDGSSAFANFVVGANRKVGTKAILAVLNAKKARFATGEELQDLTGLVPGSVPPFGRPLLPFDLYLDADLPRVTEVVAFNAGSLTNSVIMPIADYLKVAMPTMFAFAE